MVTVLFVPPGFKISQRTREKLPIVLFFLCRFVLQLGLEAGLSHFATASTFTLGNVYPPCPVRCQLKGNTKLIIRNTFAARTRTLNTFHSSVLFGTIWQIALCGLGNVLIFG